MSLASALYSGQLQHRRHQPRGHQFRYRITLLLLDLDEQREVFGLSALWGGRWWSPMRFAEGDYLRAERQPHESLKACAQRLVYEQLGLTLDGPVRLLTQIRSFGMLFNPVSFFYCHDLRGQLRAIICEVTNTPWGERFSYLLEADPGQQRQHFSLAKRFHVSPFLPWDAEYQMHFSTPAERLQVRIEHHQDGRRLFDASMGLQRQPLSAALLRREAVRFPFMVLRTVSGIYWQALRLLLKGIPLFDHAPAAQSVAAHSRKESGHETEQT